MEPSKSCVYIDKGNGQADTDSRRLTSRIGPKIPEFKIEIGLSMLDVIFNSLLYVKLILHRLQVVHAMIVVTMDHVRVNGRPVAVTVRDIIVWKHFRKKNHGLKPMRFVKQTLVLDSLRFTTIISTTG